MGLIIIVNKSKNESFTGHALQDHLASYQTLSLSSKELASFLIFSTSLD